MEKKQDVYLALIVTQKPVCPICEESIAEDIAMYEAWHAQGRGHKGAGIRRRDVDLTLDHLMPRSRGGSNEITNLRLVHRKCNHEKANRTLEEYKRGDKPIYIQKKPKQRHPITKEKPALQKHKWRLSNEQIRTQVQKQKPKGVVKLKHEEPPYIIQLRKLGLL